MAQKLVVVNQAAHIAELFGSQSKLSMAIGCPPTTVNRWCQMGYIRPVYYAGIWRAAYSLGIELSADDFALVRGSVHRLQEKCAA